jgi:starvation-inducible DNA-binding protein
MVANKRTDSRTDGNIKERAFPTHIDIPEKNRAELVELLNQQLADTLDLYTQTKQAHWNVKGKDFFQLHELFDTLAEAVFPYVDMIAERGTALGGMAAGTARMAAASSRLAEFPDVNRGEDCLQALIERYAEQARLVREDMDRCEQLEDLSSQDMLIEYSRELDKALWFLEAHVQA